VEISHSGPDRVTTTSAPHKRESTHTPERVQHLAQLQRSAGNQAVAGLLAARASAVTVQRRPAPVPAATLSSPDLAPSPRLQEAVKNTPPLSSRERNEGVSRLQTGLRAVKLDMDQTFRSGSADGIWGQETTNAVRQLQEQAPRIEPVGGHEAGNRTLTRLDQQLVAGGKQKRSPPTPITIAGAGTGPFQPFVDAGRVSQDLAELLNLMHDRPLETFMMDAARLALAELSNGALAGVAHWSQRAGVAATSLAAARSMGDIEAGPFNGGGDLKGANAITQHFAEGSLKGLILTKNSLVAESPGSIRFAMLVLTHELMHYRNGAVDEQMRNAPPSVEDSLEYADTDIARKHAGKVSQIRLKFLQEIPPRHAAWRAGREHDVEFIGKANRDIVPGAGQIFGAAAALVRQAPGIFDDDVGYFKDLDGLGDNGEVLGKQVALWLSRIVGAGVRFHENPLANENVRRLIIQDVAAAELRNFTPPAASKPRDAFE